jgi:transposase
MYDINKLVSEKHFEILLKLLPSPRQKRLGRKRCNKRYLLTGIVQVLKLGINWRNIFDCGVSPSSCWRYFRELQRRGSVKKIFKLISEEKTDISECASDTDSTLSYRFKKQTGYDGRKKYQSTKISLLTDKQVFVRHWFIPILTN